MKVAIGKVVEGNVVVEGARLPEGEIVTVLVREADEEGFTLEPEQKADLLASMAEADRGEFAAADVVLQRLR